ncbi:DUF397 domain-containing protein [Streptomyces sp. AP-93]|uniref:DUF397 domain-containing protein n=1 Tax=Streptomyces sp. AP-93 TaxID=2929048 RepID=UPI001FAF6BA1|nr:DUF397 domain-containing protein [Streptomyces sp. AP-93]MCJ0870231.1 DUF397 domain-containing protein [Streptomyces sp. AP-93]
MTQPLNWRTSTYTRTDNCVEVADDVPEGVMVRDSKCWDRGTMTVGSSAWSSFVDYSKVSDRS